MANDTEPIRIDFQQNLKSIIKFGFAVQVCCVLIALPLFFYMGFVSWKETPIISLLFFGGGIFVYWIGKKYFANLYYKEYILLDDESLQVIYETGKTKKKIFNVEEIRELGFVGDTEFTPHPLNNEIIDFTGLGVAEKEVQFLINEGTMVIKTENETFRFGKNIPSWEAERIIEIVSEKLDGKIKTYSL
jgi:hypothetical protein